MHEHGRALEIVDHDLHVGPGHRGEPCGRRGIAVRPADRLDGVLGGVLEARGHALHDRPKHVVLRRHVGVQAGALDVHRSSDIPDAGAGIAPLTEQGAGHVLDLAATCGLDHAWRAS